MVNVQPHIRASWGGTLGTPGVEVWTNSLNLMGLTGGATAGADGASLRGLLPALATIVKNFHGANGTENPARGVSGISTQALLTWVKLNFIGADGKYRDNPNTLAVTPGQNGGGTRDATHALPDALWQQSAVISLRTAISRGRGSHGRIYPPACGIGPGADGYMDNGFTNAMQANAVRLIGDMNKLVGAGGSGLQFNVCIVSAARNGQPPINTPVTRLHVDRIPDVQRRRVNRLASNATADTNVFLNT